MTPLPAAPPAQTVAPGIAPRAKLPVHPGEPDGQPSFEAVRQDVEATMIPEKVEPASLSEATGDALPVAPTPILPSVVPVVPVVLPQGAVAHLDARTQPAAAFPQGNAPQPVSLSAKAAKADAPTFFKDSDTAPTDAADFAADLLAALGSTAASASVTDVKAAARIDASATIDIPATADVFPDLDMTSDAWLDQLTRDITATASADGKLSFRIVPPQLGRLDINIEARDAGVAVHMKTETREAQSIIAAAQPRLETALGQNGLRVAETSVASNGQENLPKHQFTAQKALIEAVNEHEPEADTPTLGRAAGRFA